jgi:hypothetical protein
MASPRTSEREEERRFNLRTLVIASAASATAAVLTSQLWIAGTWLAAAVTPVLVTVISELLHRPTDRIAERLTADRPALRRDRVEPSEPATPPPVEQPAPPSEPGSAPVRVYRSSAAKPRRRKIAVGAVLGTSALALLIAVVVLTVPELLAGGAIGKSDSRTTLFRGDREPKSSEKDKQQTPSKTRDEQQATEPTTAPPSDEATAPETTTTTTTTTPTTQESTATTPAPAPNQQP